MGLFLLGMVFDGPMRNEIFVVSEIAQEGKVMGNFVMNLENRNPAQLPSIFCVSLISYHQQKEMIY